MSNVTKESLRKIAGLAGFTYQEDVEETAPELNALLQTLREFDNEDIQKIEPTTRFTWEPRKRK